MRIDVITIFPGMVRDFAAESLLGKARERGLLDVRVHDLRDATTDVHRTVDDAPSQPARYATSQVSSEPSGRRSVAWTPFSCCVKRSNSVCRSTRTPSSSSCSISNRSCASCG